MDADPATQLNADPGPHPFLDGFYLWGTVNGTIGISVSVEKTGALHVLNFK
jgi:hypothetical protein